MSSVPQDSPSRGLIILLDLLKQVVTLSLASTGFLFTRQVTLIAVLYMLISSRWVDLRFVL